MGLSIPSLGLAPEFMPIASASNIPMMVYQAQKSATMGQFELLLDVLQTQNNPVYSKIIPNIMSFFYDESPSIESQNNAKALAPNIRKMIAVLEKHKVPVVATPVKK